MLKTSQGDFASYAQLRKAYLDAYNGNPTLGNFFNKEPWQPRKLHISDLGKCPRKQMLRISGAKERPVAPETAASKELMFWQGNMIHALTVGAMQWADILIDYEQGLHGLKDPWVGHYDLLYWDLDLEKLVLWDGKTVRSNAFSYAYSWPKPADQKQMQGYLRFEQRADLAFVEYIDRGGAKRAKPVPIARDDNAVAKRMAEMERHLRALDDFVLPPMLEPTYTATYRKVNNEPDHLISGVYYGPSWECAWCEFLYGVENKKSKEWTIFDDSPCKPDMTPSKQVAKYTNGVLKEIDENRRTKIQAYVETQLPSWQDEEDDVE